MVLEKSSFSNFSSTLQQEVSAYFSTRSLVDSQDTTIQQINKFSIDSVLRDFEREAPHLYEEYHLVDLFMDLSQSSRNVCDKKWPAEEKKAAISLCTLLNARTNRANRFQLLVSIMLTARATSKQVRLYTF